MSIIQICTIAAVTCTVCLPTAGLAQTINIEELFIDLRIAEKEEAAAKEVRLKWIDQERTRIRDELQKYGNELAELKKTVPDPLKARDVPAAIAKSQERERLTFNVWASNNDPSRNSAIMKGSALNALLRVIGPIAHYRRRRGTAGPSETLFPSLSPSEQIRDLEATHFRMVPATSAGSHVTIRLNQLPLGLQWPPVVTQNWSSDCKRVEKLRDEFVAQIPSAASNVQKHLGQAELLDSALSLLQAKVLQKKRSIPEDTSLGAQKRNQIHRDLQDSLRYLETVRATAERFKNAPLDYKMHHFPNGNVEEFLDFCYTHGMVFQEARPADEEYYQRIFRRIQDYASDIQFVEDWKSDLNQRIQELNDTDKQLVWKAADQ